MNIYDMCGHCRLSICFRKQLKEWLVTKLKYMTISTSLETWREHLAAGHCGELNGQCMILTCVFISMS